MVLTSRAAVLVRRLRLCRYRMPRVVRAFTRGTVFSLPTPKMGRVDNIVLTEDQKELHRPKPKVKGYDIFTDNYISSDSPFQSDKKVNAKKGIGMKPRTDIKIGVGRSNPNAVKKKTGNKKKK